MITASTSVRSSGANERVTKPLVEEILHGLNRNVLSTFNAFDETVAIFFWSEQQSFRFRRGQTSCSSIHSRKAVPGMDTAS
jgi:hypothetical protein